ncbi:centriole, cilia and spindle-associated protein-like isoform X2 [Patiria miniata]|uniref:Centriole, cilia and spindle-associated protein n=1 Tax=Patiria miniata TaxID=46514 RepID=A0A914BFM9_PATMI|nr:centriole, cilia and spindle-associated protein-like isoform X2 [Patiria miniata]
MVFKKSEYRKQYRDPEWDAHFPHYQEKVDYRVSRRRLEHHHQIFDWDWDSENGNSEENGRRGSPRPATAPNRNNSQARQGRRAKERHVEVSDREVQTPEWSKMRGGPSKDPIGWVAGENLASSPVLDEKQMHKGHMGQTKDSRPTKKHKASGRQPSRDRRRARPSTAPAERVDAKQEVQEQPPMVAYGWADQELTTGSKKTHNIRASADIYPSALRAMRRRELDIQRQTERDRQHNLREQKLKAMFNMQPRDDTVWLTEYQRNFAGPAELR